MDNLLYSLIFFPFRRNLKLEFRKYKEKIASSALIHMSKIQYDDDDESSISSHSATKNESKTQVLMPLSTFMGSHQDYKITAENMQPVDTGDIETVRNYSNLTGTEAQEAIPDDKNSAQANNEPSITMHDQEQFQEVLSAENLLTYYNDRIATSSNIPLNGQRYVRPLPENKASNDTRFFSAQQQATTAQLRTPTQTQPIGNQKRLIKEVSIPKVPELPVAIEDQIEGTTNLNFNCSSELLETTNKNINDNKHLEFTASWKTPAGMVEEVERQVFVQKIDHEKYLQSENAYEYEYSQMSNGVFYLDISDEEEFII